MKLFSAVLLMAALTIQGCGGGKGCTADVRIVGKSRFAGSYAATFTPNVESPKPVSFTFDVDRSGLIEGSVTEPGDTAATATQGEAGEVGNSCSTSGTGIRLTLLADTSFKGTLDASRPTDDSLVGSYDASLNTLEGPSQGTLTVAKVVR